MKYGYVANRFLSHNTVTSRLSSENPNAQNFPRKSNNPKEFQYNYGPKKLYTSRFGDEGVIMQFDYCLAGDTLIRTAFQGDLPIKEIVERVNNGEDIYVYSCDPETNDIVVSRVEKGMLTFKNRELFDVYLDNGEIVRATAEHPFMMRNGQYKHVSELQPNDSLMGFREYEKVDDNGFKYLKIGVDFQSLRNEHRIISEYFDKTFHHENTVFHKDGNGLNNNPENLITLHKYMVAIGSNLYEKEDIAYEKRKRNKNYEAGIVKGRRTRIRNTAERIKVAGERLNSENWVLYKDRGTPRWETAYEDLLIMKMIENHKVVAVVPAGSEDVYDIKVENHSNFALSAGIFVHNSQLELRVAAIFSKDENLIQAYKDGKDIHVYVASKVNGIPESEVTDDARTAAKAVGFGQQ